MSHTIFVVGLKLRTASCKLRQQPLMSDVLPKLLMFVFSHRLFIQIHVELPFFRFMVPRQVVHFILKILCSMKKPSLFVRVQSIEICPKVVRFNHYETFTVNETQVSTQTRNGVQTCKSSMSREICHLEHCKSISRENKRLDKQNNTIRGTKSEFRILS